MATEFALVGQGRQTYYAAVTGLALAAAATDVFTLTGAPGRLIRPVKAGFSGVATAAGAFSFVVAKRSTANTGGTATTPTAVPASSTHAPAKGIVRAYTANPTTGTLVGNMMSMRDTLTTAAGGLPEAVTTIDFEGEYRGDIELRSETEVLALNLNGATVTGGIIDAWICWTEEQLVA